MLPDDFSLICTWTYDPQSRLMITVPMLSAVGRYPTLREALQLARQVGRLPDRETNASNAEEDTHAP